MSIADIIFMANMIEGTPLEDLLSPKGEHRRRLPPDEAADAWLDWDLNHDATDGNRGDGDDDGKDGR